MAADAPPQAETTLHAPAAEPREERSRGLRPGWWPQGACGREQRAMPARVAKAGSRCEVHRKRKAGPLQSAGGKGDMKGMLFGLVFMLALVAASCYDDEDDDTYQSENCTSVDYGGGQTYTLCCRLTCTAKYDDGDYSERCAEENSCTSSTGEPCPPVVVQENRYPACLY